MLDTKAKAILAKRLSKRPVRLSEDDRDSLVMEYAAGADPKALARKYKVSVVTVYKWIKRAAQ
jgi:transposase-like protein